MSGQAMQISRGALGWKLLRSATPVLFYPLGVAYCLFYDLVITGSLLPPGDVLNWAMLALTPWVVAALIFERSVRPGDTRNRIVRRALVLALAAYVLSGLGGTVAGLDLESAFLRRVPLIATAILIAAIYPLVPLPARVTAADGAAGETMPVCADEVRYASGAGNYIELHCDGRVALWRQTMRGAEDVLRPAGFVRIHRSHLVSLEAIEQVQQTRKGPVEIVLDNGERLPVSASYAANLANCHPQC